MLDEFERSGLSGAKFARLVGVQYATFANWVQKRRKARANPCEAFRPTAEVAGSGPVRLFEAYVPSTAASGRAGLLIELPGGGRIEVESPVQLRLAAELLSLLGHGGRRPC